MTVVTECCGVPIQHDWRFCPKCGHEARINPSMGPPMGSIEEEPQYGKDPMAEILGKIHAHDITTRPVKRRGTPMTGTIARLMPDRGFGFIKGEDGKDYFFHRSHTHSNFIGMKPGDVVDFEVLPSRKGPRAERVTKK